MYDFQDRIVFVDVDSLIENPANWELHGKFDPAGRDAWLIDDIAHNGILSPIIAIGNNIEDGHRRRRAAMQCGLQKVPVIHLKDANAAECYRSAQLGRSMSLYAKCVLFEDEINRAVTMGVDSRLDAMQNHGDRSEERSEANETWITLELILNCKRDTLRRGVSLLGKLAALAAEGKADLSHKARAVFRDRGVRPAMRLLGEADQPEQDDEDAEGPDCDVWSQAEPDDAKPPKAKAKTAQAPEIESEPDGADVEEPAVVAFPKSPDKWRNEYLKTLSGLELVLRKHGLLHKAEKSAIDVLENAVSETRGTKAA